MTLKIICDHNIMAKHYKRKNFLHINGIILVIFVICITLYLFGVPNSLILNIVIIGLILAIIIYIFVKPIIGLASLLRDIYKRYAINITIRNTSNIDDLNWSQFEHYVVEKLKQQGYDNVRLTEKYDLGVDIIAEKDGVRWGVQVKHSKYPVKIEAVREAVAALKIYKCNLAMVVTNNLFTNPAKKLAQGNNCVLVDRSVLAKWS